MIETDGIGSSVPRAPGQSPRDAFRQEGAHQAQRIPDARRIAAEGISKIAACVRAPPLAHCAQPQVPELIDVIASLPIARSPRQTPPLLAVALDNSSQGVFLPALVLPNVVGKR